MIMTDIEEFFNLTPVINKENKQDIEIIPKKDSLINKEATTTTTIMISGEEFIIGNRVRIKENINRFKQSQLVEIIGINKDGEIHIRSVYDHSKLYVTPEQLYFD